MEDVKEGGHALVIRVRVQAGGSVNVVLLLGRCLQVVLCFPFPHFNVPMEAEIVNTGGLIC